MDEIQEYNFTENIENKDRPEIGVPYPKRPPKINRLNDRFIKYLFGTERNKSLLLDFINDALYTDGESKILDLELNTGELAQSTWNAKLSRLDISARLDNGSTADIEVQIINYHDFTKRFPYYWAMRHARQMKAGDSYIDIKPTILICVLAFDILDEKDYRNTYSIRNDGNGNSLCDDMKLVFLELPKFKKTITEPQTGLERWLLYFSNEEGEKMTQLVKNDPVITAAMLIESEFWADEKERDLYFRMQRQLMDEMSAEKSIRVYARQQALEEGIKEGMEKGEHLGKLETARKMLSRNMDIATVCDLTGLSHVEIMELRDRAE